MIIAEIPHRGFFGFLAGELADVALLREQRRHLAPMRLEPVFGADGQPFARRQRRLQTKHRVGFLIDQVRHWPNVIRLQLAPNVFSELPDFIVERSGVKLQIVIYDQFFYLVHLEWHAHRDADGADREQL